MKDYQTEMELKLQELKQLQQENMEIVINQYQGGLITYREALVLFTEIKGVEL